MSNHSFDRVEATLKNLKDIVELSHSHSAETNQLVSDMENLISEIRQKLNFEPQFQIVIDTSPMTVAPVQATAVAVS